MWFDLLSLGASVIAGAIASITGFGIGSVLTPVFGLRVATNVAVAAVSVPHVAGTALRFLLLRRHVDRRVVLSFGLTSAAGGLAGALWQRWASSPWLTVLFGSLLIFTATSELTGLARRMMFRGTTAWIAGALSGVLGGLVGNQGGIRSAALLGFDVPKDVFVASATAVGLIVDGARMPVYFATTRHEMTALLTPILIATAGVLAGTLFGRRALAWIPESSFRSIVALLIGILGIAMLIKGLSHS